MIEANTYLSGVGFESGGLAAAHAVHNGLTAIPDAHHYYHGEKVAFGTLTQLVLENAPVEEIETVAALSHAVGLPITLAQLDIKEDVPAKMRIVAEAACAEGETIHNMPGGATPDQVYAALLVADQYGQRFLQEWNNLLQTPGLSGSLNAKLPDALRLSSLRNLCNILNMRAFVGRIRRSLRIRHSVPVI